ncbi:hypothetical protein ACFMBG_14820 [Leisingera sp. D0M16]|uniref:hypothetical protein n=1 Tax=Leisingera coralii TaxID=3351347 RepID=UPI003B81FD23
MANQFDRDRGPTGMGWTPHEKALIDSLAKGPPRIEVKHCEPLKEPVIFGNAAQRDVGGGVELRLTRPPGSYQRRPKPFGRFVRFLIIAVGLTGLGSVIAIILWGLFQVVRGFHGG